eukprot:3700947-Prymnesium_polylepis.1
MSELPDLFKLQLYAHQAQVNSTTFSSILEECHEGLFIFGVEIQDLFSAASGQAPCRRRSQDPRPDRARGGAGGAGRDGRVVMGWSGAPVPPLKAAALAVPV